MKKDINAYLGSGIFLIVALIIMFAKPFSPNLNETGQMVLGGILVTVGIWIFKPFKLPFSMGGAFLIFFLLVQKLAPSVVFSGFTQSALWTLIPALFFGYVLQKTGLGKRIAFAIIKLFKPSYPSMILAWTLIGVVLSILTPSITVRVAIVMPIAVHCCELFNLEKSSKGRSLLLLTAFGTALIPGTGWLSGSLWGPIVQGLFNAVPGMEGQLTFASWFNVVFVPMEVVSLLLIIGGYFVLKPSKKLSKDAIDTLKEQKKEPLSKEEKATGIILILVFVMFLTNKIHNIPDAAVCLLAMVFFYIFKVMTAAEFSSGISWDLVVFIGTALSLGSVFSVTGISNWISGIIVPAIAPIAGNPWLFMFVITIILFLWRFIDIAILIPTMAILTPVLPSISSAYGINPLVWTLIYVMAGNSMFMSYQNMWALMSQSIAGDNSWTNSHLGKYGLVYFIACMIALLIVIPLYVRTGFLIN
jgi:anion transporter